MRKSGVALTLVLVFTAVALLAAPTQVGRHLGSAVPSATHPSLGAHASLARAVVPAAPTHMSGYPRTVLVETFTGVWCIHCPAESKALYNIGKNTSHNVLSIAELHSCAFAPGQGPCLENFVPPDKTTDTRGAWYSICGFPDVFFDGTHDSCGASDYTAPMQAQYSSAIANASNVPGTVSITQTADLVAGTVGSNVSVNAKVLSAVTGTYNAITYLMEYINKRNQSNGYGPHDVADVVRATLHNHPISLVAGETTEFNATGAVNATWKTLNLSVVTFVQQNSTKIVQNANMVEVATLAASANANLSAVTSGKQAQITASATNTTTGAPVAGATVSFSSDSGGSFTVASGVTASDGTLSTSFTAPNVSAPQTVLITADISATGYTSGSAVATLTVNPIVLSTVPSGLTVTPGNQQVSLNWTVPAAGGAGVTYHIYRSNFQMGLYSAIGVSTGLSFVDPGLSAGQSFWYKVSSQYPGGFSANTTPVSANGLTASSQGLPLDVGWWLSIANLNFSSATNDSLSVYLPDGDYSYAFGPNSYGFLATDGAGTVTVAGAPVAVTASFTPRYATLAGTVSPVTANATVDGSPIAVVDGAFNELMAAGTYTLSVSSPGFTTQNVSITLTPGNTTTKSVDLVAVPTSGGSTSTTSGYGGLTGDQMIALIAVVAVIGVAAVLVGIMRMSSKGKRGRPPRREPENSE